jgi:hypothetical protein
VSDDRPLLELIEDYAYFDGIAKWGAHNRASRLEADHAAALLWNAIRDEVSGHTCTEERSS